VGHVIPSIIYSCVALWWGFSNSLKYIRAERVAKKCSPYRGSTIMPCFCCPTKRLRMLPGESFFKMLFLTIHMLVEIGTGLHLDSTQTHYVIEHENIHHVAMLGGFLLGSYVEVAIYFGAKFPKKNRLYVQFAGILRSIPDHDGSS